MDVVSLHQLYLFGAAMQLKRMGYHMAKMNGIMKYPFGETVHPLIQQDRTPKKVFVLDVYASAVHASSFQKKMSIVLQEEDE